MQRNLKHWWLSVIQVRNIYLLLEFSFSTWGKRDPIFTILTVPISPTAIPRLDSPGPESNLNSLTQQMRCASGSPQLDWHRPESKSQLTSFSKSPSSLPIASGPDIIHTPVSFPIWGYSYNLCDCHILCTWVWTVLNVCTCTQLNSSKSNQTEW